MKIVVSIVVYGSRSILEGIMLDAVNYDFNLSPVGSSLIGRNQDFCLNSKNYFFPEYDWEDCLVDFMVRHKLLGNSIRRNRKKINAAYLNLSPVAERDECFSGIFPCKALYLISLYKMDLQVAPVVVSPEYEYWTLNG